MRASDHFYSELDAAARRNVVHRALQSRVLALAFSRLVAPVVGDDVALELFNWWQERYGAGEGPIWEKLAHIASFVLGDYDGATMDLDEADWEAIRDILSDAAEVLDLDVLSRLMVELVSRGALD
ncbi:MAG: hypothetical protein HC902_13805 [Calothrix sp. SM1_5_4]|nr:hypothetical protein [Calothrix sp. SM1_5_4]